MGNDGSGKTTVCRKLTALLRSMGYEVEYRAEFNYIIINRFLAFSALFMNRRKFFSLQKLASAKTVKPPKYLVLWFYLVYLDFVLHYWYIKLFKKNKIVILDRYAYDQLMSWEYLGLLPRLLKKPMNCFPKPDVGVILDASPEIAYQRKIREHDYPFEFYQQQRARYRRFAATTGIDVISTDKTMQVTMRQMQVVLKRYFLKNAPDPNRALVAVVSQYLETGKAERLTLPSDNQGRLMEAAKRNSLEALFFTSAEGFSFNDAQEAFKQDIDELLPDLDSALVAKSVRTFPFNNLDSDLDLYLNGDSLTCVLARASQRGWSIKVEEDSVGLYKENEAKPEIDIHPSIRFSDFEFFEGNLVWKNKTASDWSKRMFYASNEDEFMIVVTHSVFKHNCIDMGNIAYAIKLTTNEGFDWNYVRAVSTDYGWSLALNHYLKILQTYRFLVDDVDSLSPRVPNTKMAPQEALSMPFSFKPSFVLAFMLEKFRSDKQNKRDLNAGRFSRYFVFSVYFYFKSLLSSGSASQGLEKIARVAEAFLGR